MPLDNKKENKAKETDIKKDKNNSYMFYPNITDSDFSEKIYLKKEFRMHEIKNKPNYSSDFSYKKDFTLEPHQLFIRNYISPDTPYNGILIYGGTGIGKTCTAISIAEGFKKAKYINKKILVLSTLKQNFMKELYNFQKERTNQCTGKDYDLGIEGMYLTQQQKEREIDKLKKKYYQFYGYKKFANDFIQNTGGWKGTEEDINDKLKKYISNEFDNRIIIIDEIQNIKTDRKDELTKNIQPIIETIIKYGKNIKLILMRATPMFDRPDEIIFYINLLLQNDGRPKLNKNEIFNQKDGTLKPGAEDKLRESFTGYISYIRGEKPFIFPFKLFANNSIIPKNYNYYMSGEKIEDSKKIKFTQLILCDMNNVQKETYKYYFEKKIKDGKINKINDNIDEDIDENIINNKITTNNKHKSKETNNDYQKKDIGMLFDLKKISNIVYPSLDISNLNNQVLSKIGSFTKSAIESDTDNGLGGYYKSIKLIGSKRKVQYKYQSHAIFNKDTKAECPFADEKYIENYSTKFAKILETIKKSKGLVLIYSDMIEQGVLPLALILEQNGFYRECASGEDQLLDYPVNKMKGGGKKRQICYCCGEYTNHDNHINEKSKDFHHFKIAKYILYFGETKDIIKVTKDEAFKKFSRDKNKRGEEIKVFIGTRVISEGLDFKRLRQVHIIEPWYNLSRNEQIIGRAVRNYSHSDLSPEENNVEVYQYVSVLTGQNKESIDLKNYRIAENKDIIIKNINRIMKESAVDCIFLKNSNIVDSDKKIKQISSSGKSYLLSIKDNEYSSMCDYKKECNYKCNWVPNPRIKYPLNNDTYNINFALNDIEKIKKIIKGLFRTNIVYSLSIIENSVKQIINDIEDIYIYTALDDLVENKNEIIYDKFSRKGYIIYRGDYYIFQPFDLDRDDIPIIYRQNPMNIKPERIDLVNIETDYDENNNNIKSVINTDDILKTFLNNIDFFNKSHINIIKNNRKNEIEYMYSIIGFTLDSIEINKQILLIEYLLKIYYNKTTKYDKDIINKIIDYLDYEMKLINYYSSIKYDKSKIKNKIFVGFIINKKYYILEQVIKDKDIETIKLDKADFIEASKDYINKIKEHKSLCKTQDCNIKSKYNYIYGIIEYNKLKDINIFKIVDKSMENEIFTKNKKISKRSIIKGRMCETLQTNKLIELRNKLGMYKIEGKKRNSFICEDIQIYFRYMNFVNKKLIWIENIEI